jgi:HK97 gp10 family phage protein
MAKGFKIEGMKELEKAIKKLGQVPQKAVTPAARKGMNIAFKDAKINAPVDVGNLKQGMKLIGEKSKYKGKKTYRIVFDRAMNKFFQKPVKNPGPGKKDTAYYPVSQEYGFFAKNGRYIPGFRFVEKGLTENANKIEKTIVDEMGKRIDKALKG